MPRKRKHERVRCPHFKWTLLERNGQWYADGRSNAPNAGRHSLGTNDKQEALRRLPALDRVQAETLGLIAKSKITPSQPSPLSLEEGRRLYEAHIARPRVAGGTRKSTQKKYRATFDKFLPFAKSAGTTVWNGITSGVLTDYAAHLEKLGYAPKSILNDLTTLKQTIKWLINERRLDGMEPVNLSLRKVESEHYYCYTSAQVKAMLKQCRGDKKIDWLAGVIVTLACTGLRISELASLRWSDIDFENERLTLTDESGQPIRDGQQRREVKSGRSRSFPIHPDLLSALKGMGRQNRYIFLGPRGGRLKPDTVRRIFVRDVIEPLSEQFPSPDGEKGFKDGRFHSFRSYFCSTCANTNVPERMVMDWLGHADSQMIRHYYHLHDAEAKRRMDSVDFLGGASGRSAGRAEGSFNEEDVEPTPERSAEGDSAD